mmetsp:Transcript_8321/g.25791  ORF Transcript_8321/g.25791 Transcript_8321/m.25791 type:complete len:123 (-) Transcript_8321:866-1234(-)
MLSSDISTLLPMNRLRSDINSAEKSRRLRTVELGISLATSRYILGDCSMMKPKKFGRARAMDRYECLVNWTLARRSRCQKFARLAVLQSGVDTTKAHSKLHGDHRRETVAVDLENLGINVHS